MTSTIAFTGPIFIVGMPRSGTKLLREILNNHSLVGITPNESHCIPYFYQRFESYGDLKIKDNFKQFYSDFCKTIFFQRLTQSGFSIDLSVWYNKVDEFSYSRVIETFYSIYARQKGKQIWGDKTPLYLKHLDLLYRLFPNVKVIHIIRDPRDYCLSVNKAWQKNIYRAAQLWVDNITNCRRIGLSHLNKNYFEIKYETLIKSPKTSIKAICEFLTIPFEDGMLILKHPSENIGDAKGVKEILPTNFSKYQQFLNPSQIMRIEKICCLAMGTLNYHSHYKGPVHRINARRMRIYKFLDSISVLYTDLMSNHDLLKTLRNALQARRVTDNRYFNALPSYNDD